MEPEFKEITRQPEKREEIKEPKISFQILYSSHRTAKDIKKMAELLSGADVYAPECYDWTPELLVELQAISQGKKTPQELMWKHCWSNDSSWAKIFGIIYKSQKPILFADLGMGHELLEDIHDQAKGLRIQSFFRFQSGDFQEALQTMRDYAAKFAEFQLAREEIIKDNLETKIKEVIKNDPRFSAKVRQEAGKGGSVLGRPGTGKASGGKNKKEIKVLLTLGSGHTRLYHSLKKEDPFTVRQYANLPNIFGSEGEAIRRLMFSKEVKDELLAKIFIENYLINYFDQITNDTNKIFRIVRQITAKISLDEIKNLSENWTDERSRGLPLILGKFFESKGIKIPETEREIDEMLKEKAQNQSN